MKEEHILGNIVIIIAAAVFAVGLFRQLRLSPVLGYLVAGAIIGDNGLKVVTYSQTKLLGEFGVVFLLFAIGLELSLERLKVMSKYVFGLGSLQVLATSIIIAGAVALWQSSNAAIIIGGGLALSSTALVMQIIEETRNQSTRLGRISLAILLLQDFVVVPLLVIVNVLSSNGSSSILVAVGAAVWKAVLALLAIFFVGRLMLRPLFKLISTESNYSNELPIAITLLIVLSAAYSTEYFGLSLALGAFVAGVLVAETEFRIQAEESIYPFKHLLLGLFFMTVGMNIDVKEIYNQITAIVTFSIVLIIVKTLIIAALCILFGFNKRVSLQAGLLLSQGGEFAFILFDLAKKYKILEEGSADVLLLVITCTMALTPLLAALGRRISEENNETTSPYLKALELDTRDLVNHVIIAGCSKVGKMAARVLRAEGINYVAIDINGEVVKVEKKNGFSIFEGDISKIDILKAIGIDRSLAVILTMGNEVTVKKSLKAISANFSNIDIIVRAKNFKRANEFYREGASTVISEENETGLQLGGTVLKIVGVSDYEINRIKEQFRISNYSLTKGEESLIEPEEND